MQIFCPICEGACHLLDAVEFYQNTRLSVEHIPSASMPVSYLLCEKCGFCFAPEFSEWRLEDFESKIYNSDYVLVDPDYQDVRPRANARHLCHLFGDQVPKISHLDYGGGKGLLSEVLRESGWQSSTYDPFVDRDMRLEDLGKFDLITAYEVFEHVPDVLRLINDLALLLNEKGTVLFSTLLSDGNIKPNQPLTWWYAKPRNGHISLFSRKSLSMLGAKVGFNFFSFSQDFHAFCRHIPPWAAHAIHQTPA